MTIMLRRLPYRLHSEIQSRGKGALQMKSGALSPADVRLRAEWDWSISRASAEPDSTTASNILRRRTLADSRAARPPGHRSGSRRSFDWLAKLQRWRRWWTSPTTRARDSERVRTMFFDPSEPGSNEIHLQGALRRFAQVTGAVIG